MPHRTPSGFTLIEILIVVMIIGLLTSVLAVNLFSRVDPAKIDIARTQIRQLEAQLEMYKLDNGRYPSAEQGLEALVYPPTSGPEARRYQPGGYVKRDQIIDPWKEPYHYVIPGQHNSHSFDLYSFGPDQAEGGDDDITNWDTGSS